MTSPPSPRRAPLALGIAAATLAIQNGIVMAFAVLYLPLIREFGGSRAEVAVVQSAVFLVGGFSSPLVGWAFDRLGPRRLLQGGALLGASAFAAASRVDSLPALIVLYGVVGGLALVCLGSQVNMLLAALWYPTARGRAIAVADLGTGFGAFCFIPLAQVLVSAIGWRGTLLVWAGLLLAVVIPLNAFQRLPPAEVIVPRAAAGGVTAPAAWTVRAALASAPFWWLAAMRFFAACAFPMVNTHVVAYAIGRGVAPAAAATALGTVALVSLGGRLTTGYLCDRIGRAATLSVMYVSCALGIGCLTMLALTGSPTWLAVYVAFYGMSQGSSGIVASARAADVFAGPAFGAIWGLLGLATGPGEALGAWLGGRIFDATGSYLPAFGVAVGALIIGVVCVWRVRTYPR
ncbi:MAG: MFS transporter [Candidatus Rokubacteria bacterium]|nr:MFS transporter [Candidatus Rokubacteria bacterium]